VLDQPANGTKVARARWLNFTRLALKYWTGDKARQAWIITTFVVGFVAFQLAMQLAMNGWNRLFFDALEKRQIDALQLIVVWLPLLILGSVAATCGGIVARMTLQVRWREWLTKRIAGWWIEDQRYYRLGIANEDQTAPEYRIAEDVRLAIEPLVDFAIGVLTAVATATAFFGILWSVGGSITLNVAGQDIVIPGYLALAAILYTFATSSSAYLVGKPMVGVVTRKNEAEAQFRAEMTRLRENAESIALIRGDADERKSVIGNYGRVAAAWIGVVRRHGIIASVQSTNGALVPVVPLILASPKFLSGEMSLGGVMQLVAAFITVQVSLNWFIDNFIRIAEWFASANRVDELVEALEDLDVATLMEGSGFITFGTSDDDKIHIENLSIAHRNGRVVIADAHVVIQPGEKVLVGGESGTGKSTLIRALAHLWPWGSGTIRLPKGQDIAFVPQKPYIPLGTLRQAIVYPRSVDAVSDEMITGALRRCGLGYLVKRLEEDDRWDQILSGGERQRIAFARILLQRPSIIIMDEATSALDEDSQSSLLQLFNEDLAYATVVSVGHRPGLEEFHDRKLTLDRRAAGAHVSSRRLEKSLWHLFRDVRTS
jgi:vitamin B12/bleomycin/antimicrobial peptide transport system ATP-binding/permease protein